jgi:hypothetical protein
MSALGSPFENSQVEACTCRCNACRSNSTGARCSHSKREQPPQFFDHLATLAHISIVRHNLLKGCDVFRLPKLWASTAFLWSDIVMNCVSHGKEVSGGEGGRMCGGMRRVFAICETRLRETSSLRAIHFTETYPYGVWVKTRFTHFSYPHGYDFALFFGSRKELPVFPIYMGRK